MDQKPNRPRSSNLFVCYVFIGLSLLIMLGTAGAAFLLKNKMRIGETKGVESMSDGFRIESLNRQIESVEREIETLKRAPDSKPDNTTIESLKKISNKKVDPNIFSVVRDKAKEIKQLEFKRSELIKKRDSTLGELNARQYRSRSFGELFDDFGGEVFFAAVLPLGLFSLFLARFVFGGSLPDRNPLSLTDFERRSILFLAFSLVFSAFGFFVFLWILIMMD